MAFPLMLLGALAAVWLLGVVFGRSSWKGVQKAMPMLGKRRPRVFQTDDPNDPVEELLDFDFLKEPPRPYRAFKTRTHVAMGIQKGVRNDWIQIDRGYLDRLKERIDTMHAHPEDAVGVNEHSRAAVIELFTEVILKHVPRRFPTMFSLSGSSFHNKVTGKTYDTAKALVDGEAALRILCENVEEDFYFMCPDGQGEWRLQGFIACFPGGFWSRSRLGQSFRDIHQPVPHYNERIANGVDKFVTRMTPGSLIERFNWSLQVDGPDLFRLDGNNFYPDRGDTLPDVSQDIDLQQCYLRHERQTLKCLPKSRAIVFCVRSYMTPLHEIIHEGNGVELAEAVKSMPEKLGHYKKRPFWERDIYEYLYKGHS